MFQTGKYSTFNLGKKYTILRKSWFTPRAFVREPLASVFAVHDLLIMPFRNVRCFLQPLNNCFGAVPKSRHYQITALKRHSPSGLTTNINAIAPIAFIGLRRLSSSKIVLNETSDEDDTKLTKSSPTEEDDTSLIYEGPFGPAVFRLKRVSISTCFLGLVGLPIMAFLYGTGDAPTAKLAVGSTAMLAAAGSTLTLSYCMTPYVHTIEKVTIHDKPVSSSTVTSISGKSSKLDTIGESQLLLKASTCNIFSMQVDTVFDPATDVLNESGMRPFTNFVAKGQPMYIHAGLLDDVALQTQLIGVQVKQDSNETSETDKKKQDEDFF